MHVALATYIIESKTFYTAPIPHSAGNLLQAIKFMCTVSPRSICTYTINIHTVNKRSYDRHRPPKCFMHVSRSALRWLFVILHMHR